MKSSQLTFGTVYNGADGQNLYKITGLTPMKVTARIRSGQKFTVGPHVLLFSGATFDRNEFCKLVKSENRYYKGTTASGTPKASFF